MCCQNEKQNQNDSTTSRAGAYRHVDDSFGFFWTGPACAALHLLRYHPWIIALFLLGNITPPRFSECSQPEIGIEKMRRHDLDSLHTWREVFSLTPS